MRTPRLTIHGLMVLVVVAGFLIGGGALWARSNRCRAIALAVDLELGRPSCLRPFDRLLAHHSELARK